ncbi:MAG TPA: universal stress protein [Desulfatiglandales bacterium]|nr:universal stress protein [Desulfatiglandales bacterium]
MFKKILYPTDFSDISKKALEYIKKLKGAGAKEIVLLHVIDEREIEKFSQYAKPYLDVEEIEKDNEENIRQEMKDLENQLRESGFSVKSRIEKGIPFKDILRVEKEEKVSVLVMGSHGKSCIEEMLLGSVSEKVVRKSSMPVLVIRR